MTELPDLGTQESWWTDWLVRNDDPSVFRDRVAEIALEVAQRVGARRTLDAGCGTGWLSALLGRSSEVVGTDLSQTAAERARAAHPHCRFVAGDFLRVDLGGPFDLVVSCDLVGHLADHAPFFERCHSLLNSRGTLLLFTQNPFVWRRTSFLTAQGEGQIRNWPTRTQVRLLLSESGFDLARESSLLPGGDRGVLRARRYLQALARVALVGKRRGDAVLERLLLGRSLVFEAVRSA